jgi:hypothetical protein
MRSSAILGPVAMAIWFAAMAISLAGPAGADPDDGPCAHTMSLLCMMSPAFPNLDHDIDLTKDADPVTGQPASLEPSPPPPR